MINVFLIKKLFGHLEISLFPRNNIVMYII